ncbi:NADPH-dependent F420 reductase [Gordonia otitidis]|uniref:Oxidoreductase n=1 Tax=Gordonia otitidis (strain DSM 44809 / CCUG 52243 / JCM 12355 / NBRC 100426 / IFM 10032) TaxID=1108044 RepID=H5TIJ5_GORO1|nr:NADPH-dependent F420 reductase [Gordonia otitidis]GAB33303.1 putative oxidoreductase [Gordonia otitidis NBRC 100426]
MTDLGIIGAGHIGTAVARVATAAGYTVTLGSRRGPDGLRALADELSATPGTPEDAAREGELVLVAVPFSAIADLPRDALAGKILIDATNYVPWRDGTIDALERDRVATSAYVQDLYPDSRVVKAFNHIVWSDIPNDARPAGVADRRGIAIAGDHTESIATVEALVDRLGFEPVNIGPLDQSWRIQIGSPGWITNYSADELVAKIREAETWHSHPINY